MAQQAAAIDSSDRARLCLGLFTADVVGALILFGLRPNIFAEALRGLRRLLGY
jgi:hypothetical protein